MGNDLYLFNEKQICILHTKKIEQFSALIRSYLGINLSKNIDSNVLNINALFLPFYLDQDSGWNQPFESFGKIGSKSNALRFHTTIFSDDYFNLSMKKNELNFNKKRIKIEYDQNQRLLNLFIDKFKGVNLLSIDENRFKASISELMTQLNELNKSRNETLKALEKLNGERYSIEFNIEKLHKNIDGITKDYKFALNSEEIMTCPMCGAEIDNDESSRFQYLKDRDDCKELLIENEKKLDDVKIEINKKMEESKSVSDNIKKIQEILNKRQEDLSLKDVIEGRVKEEIESVLKGKCSELSGTLSQLSSEIDSIDQQLKLEGKDERRKDIQKDFSSNVFNALESFGIKRNHSDTFAINAKINTSGSNGSKLILAYYYGLLTVMNNRGCPIEAPVVIDGPKQKGIEQESLNNILKFMLEHRPIEGQFIVSLTEDENIGDITNTHYILLESDSNVMNTEEYKSVKDEIETLLASNFRLENI